jgi:hypothetical protein
LADAACVTDDAVHGVQITNVNELRATTVDKALNYLDAALAIRNDSAFFEKNSLRLMFQRLE